MKYLTNSFSLNMIKREHLLGGGTIEWRPYNGTLEDLRNEMKSGDRQSCLGHQQLVDILGDGFAMNRCTVSLTTGDDVVVLQYIGTRLPEGAIELPEGATLELFQLKLFRNYDGFYE